jgi:hypothetical protein
MGLHNDLAVLADLSRVDLTGSDFTVWIHVHGEGGQKQYDFYRATDTALIVKERGSASQLPVLIPYNVIGTLRFDGK